MHKSLEVMLMTKSVAVVSLCFSLGLATAFPANGYANCEGIAGAAHFSLYKNRQATFNSVADADYKQRYEIEWFVGSKSLGSVTKNGDEPYVLEGSSFSSLAFSVTGYYQEGNQWSISHHKIFPGRDGGIQVRFEDGTCDNSFDTSPDLKVIINIK